MAKRQIAKKDRNAARKRQQVTIDAPSNAEQALVALREAVEEERGRLMRAHTVLQCVLDAMAFAEENEAESPERVVYFPSVLELAQEMVNQVIRRLDRE